jgi:hypothetical protein
MLRRQAFSEGARIELVRQAMRRPVHELEAVAGKNAQVLVLRQRNDIGSEAIPELLRNGVEVGQNLGDGDFIGLVLDDQHVDREQDLKGLIQSDGELRVDDELLDSRALCLLGGRALYKVSRGDDRVQVRLGIQQGPTGLLNGTPTSRSREDKRPSAGGLLHFSQLRLHHVVVVEELNDVFAANDKLQHLLKHIADRIRRLIGVMLLGLRRHEDILHQQMVSMRAAAHEVARREYLQEHRPCLLVGSRVVGHRPNKRRGLPVADHAGGVISDELGIVASQARRHRLQKQGTCCRRRHVIDYRIVSDVGPGVTCQPPRRAVQAHVDLLHDGLVTFVEKSGRELLSVRQQVVIRT